MVMEMKKGIKSASPILLALVLALYAPISGIEGVSDETTVILVSDNSADLAISMTLAISIDATIVVSPWGIFDETIAAKVVGQLPDRVIIIGGSIAVPESYVEIFKSLGINVERIGGADRFETNQLVIEWMLQNNIEIRCEKVALIHGLDFVALEEMFSSIMNGECLVLLVKEENMINITRLIEKIALPEVEVIASNLINATTIQTFLQVNITGPVEILVTLNLTPVKERERAIKAIERVKEELQIAIELANDLIEVDEEVSQSIEMVQSLLEEAIQLTNSEEYGKAYVELLEAMHLLQKIVHKVSLMISTGQTDLGFLLEQELELYVKMLNEIETSGANVSVTMNIANEVKQLIQNKEYGRAREMINQLRQSVRESMQEAKKAEKPKPPIMPGPIQNITTPGIPSPWKPPGG